MDSSYGGRKNTEVKNVEIIFSKNKWRYTAYLNALLELPYRRRMYIPGAMDLGWERFKWTPLPGGVKMAVRRKKKCPDCWGAKSGHIM